jgi:hypothetical protein
VPAVRDLMKMRFFADRFLFPGKFLFVRGDGKDGRAARTIKRNDARNLSGLSE